MNIEHRQCCAGTRKGKPCPNHADRAHDSRWYCHVHDPEGTFQKQYQARQRAKWAQAPAAMLKKQAVHEEAVRTLELLVPPPHIPWSPRMKFTGLILIFGGILVLLVSSCTVLVGAANNWEYSAGSRTGIITKFSCKGLWWKTYEGEQLQGGLRDGAANMFDFSLDAQARHGENVTELAAQIERALESGQTVELRYIEPWTTWPWRSECNHLVQAVVLR